MRIVEFHPQAWVNDYAVEVDPQGPTQYEVEDSDIESGWESDTYETDALKDHPNAPEWVREWQGPFWVDVDFWHTEEERQP